MSISMERRQVLALTGGSATLFIGYLGYGNFTGNSEPMTGENGNERRITVDQIDSNVNENTGFDIDVELVETRVTPEQPARLRVTTTNTGEPRNLSHGAGKCSIFNRDHGSSIPEGLWLHDPTIAEGIDRAGDRWTQDENANEPRTFETYDCKPHPYETDESIASEFVIWDDYRTPSYLPPGTYRFEREITIYEYEESPPPIPDDLKTLTWGFSLSVDHHD